MELKNISRPIKKLGNWDRLKAINEKLLTTEIVMRARMEISDPKYHIRTGDYNIGSIIVNLEINNDIIFRTKGKIMEIDYNPNKMPNKELMPQQIPSLVVDWFNKILKQNNFPKVNYIKDTDWTILIVLYKLREEVIAEMIYPKIKKTNDGFLFDFGKN